SEGFLQRPLRNGNHFATPLSGSCHSLRGPSADGSPLLHVLARRASVPVLVAALIALIAACTPLNSQESYLLSSTNKLRTANGLKPLLAYDPLTAKARSWAATLAAEGQLAHEDLHALGVSWTEAAAN